MGNQWMALNREVYSDFQKKYPGRLVRRLCLGVQVMAGGVGWGLLLPCRAAKE